MARETKQLESLALKSAWERYAEFDFNAKVGAKQRVYLRQAAIALAMFAVLLAVFINSYSSVSFFEFTGWWIFDTIGEVLRVVLVVVLISNFIIFALLMRTQQQESSHELRTAAEEIKKEIYLYRTVLQWHEECEVWLSDRITKIQRHVAEGFGTELILKPYHGDLPPGYDPADPNSDPGFTRLSPPTTCATAWKSRSRPTARSCPNPKRNATI